MNPAKENQEALRGARLQAFPEQNHQAHISAHLAMIATPIAQSNASIVMTLQGHISEHIAMMSEIQAQQEITANMTPEQQAMMQPILMQCNSFKIKLHQGLLKYQVK